MRCQKNNFTNHKSNGRTNILPFFYYKQMRKILLLSLILSNTFSLFAQSTSYWQQAVDYKMEVAMNANNFQYKGTQQLVYTNNSPDTLTKVYYHLYNNAFQPGSEMDTRAQSIKDADGRMVKKTKVDGKEVKESRIQNLKPDEIGYLKISNFKQNGVKATTKLLNNFRSNFGKANFTSF